MPAFAGWIIIALPLGVVDHDDAFRLYAVPGCALPGLILAGRASHFPAHFQRNSRDSRARESRACPSCGITLQNIYNLLIRLELSEIVDVSWNPGFPIWRRTATRFYALRYFLKRWASRFPRPLPC